MIVDGYSGLSNVANLFVNSWEKHLKAFKAPPYQKEKWHKQSAEATPAMTTYKPDLTACGDRLPRFESFTWCLEFVGIEEYQEYIVSRVLAAFDNSFQRTKIGLRSCINVRKVGSIDT